jgi:hypothetical protein
VSGTATKRAGLHKPGRRSSSRPVNTARICELLAGLVLLALALPPFFSFPWLGFWLVPLALIYLFLLFFLPRLWLIILPLATVGLDLTPWTGRFAYSELDLLFLVTLASGLIYGRYRLKVFSPSPAIIVLLLYLAVIALGYTGWTYLVLPPGAALDNPYYTNEYAYKVLKGQLWGLSLIPMWGYLLASDKKRTVNALVAGMSIAAIVLGLVVLWERGTLAVLLSGSAWYHVVTSLLDLSSSYRVTGLLSDMHTGGEAYDGVVLLLLPATLYAAVYGRPTWLRLLGAAGLVTLAYVTLVGFTRSTYAAFALALAVYALLSLLVRRNNGLSLPFPLAGLLAALGAGMVAALMAYRFAGSYGLASYGALLLLAYAANIMQLPGWTRHVVTGLAVASIALAVNAHFSSRWMEPSVVGVVVIILGLAASFVLSLKLFREFGAVAEINRLFVLGCIMVLPMILAFALGGYQINDRFSRISGDLDTRGTHWRDVIDSGKGGFFHQLLGNGVGSFPASYIGRHPQRVKDVGSFSIARRQQRDVLRIGGGQDLMIAQRVTIEPHADYTVTVHVRAEQPGRLGIALCERNLIYASNFTPHCVSHSISFEATDGAFEKHSVEINSGKLGLRGALGRWPTVLDLRYGKTGTVLEIDAIELSADGFNMLRNSSFKRGLDYWFSYNDYVHLPWHTKNTFLQVWFESGWLGLGLFLALLALLVRSNFARHTHDSLQPVYTTAVVAVCLFGMFGSPLDSARVSWMFYFFLAAGLARLRVRA